MTADPSTRGEPTGTSITDADPRPHVVVLGAGFAGIAAVRALRKAPVRVTLVDRHSYSTFQPLLYQVATGALNPGDITYGARGFAAHTGARFRKGEVLTIDPDTRTISLDVGPGPALRLPRHRQRRDHQLLRGARGGRERLPDLHPRRGPGRARPDDGLPRPDRRHRRAPRRLGRRGRRRRDRRGDGGHARRAAQHRAARPVPGARPVRGQRRARRDDRQGPPAVREAPAGLRRRAAARRGVSSCVSRPRSRRSVPTPCCSPTAPSSRPR